MTKKEEIKDFRVHLPKDVHAKMKKVKKVYGISVKEQIVRAWKGHFATWEK